MLGKGRRIMRLSGGRKAALGAALAGAFLAAGCARRAEGPVLAFEDFVSDLTDVAAFARPPAGRMSMISSYDRTGGNEDWHKFDNIRKDGLAVLAEAEGPGCVRRFWSTSLPHDEIYFFLDGERVRRFDIDVNGLFDGTNAPFLAPVSDTRSGGRYTYVPIPFRKSLEVAIPRPANPGLSYFHFNIETFDAAFDVESFPGVLSAAQLRAVDGAVDVWKGLDAAWREKRDACAADETVLLEAGGRVTLLEHDGPGVIRCLRLALEPEGGAGELRRAQALREAVLTMYWDGAQQPSVEVPAGDFFCNALYRRRFTSLPLANVDGVYLCRFPMPFRRKARIELRNDGRAPLTATFGARVEEGEPAADLRYFHANWTAAVSPGRPLVVLDAEGEGHLVGCYMIVWSLDGDWRILEGDEVIWVDGEASPSWHGTGLEDYFNCGWYYGDLLDLPLHGLLEKAAMRTAQYRFHLPDRVPFERSLLMTFEFGEADRSQGYMSTVAYWYQTEPRPAGTQLPGVEHRFLPLDRLGVSAAMADLFQLEQTNFQQEARERSLIYAEQLGDHELSGMFRLRAAAYGEQRDGIKAARDTYVALSSTNEAADVRAQAEQLLWFHESDRHGLLGLHANGRYRAWLNGEEVGRGDNVVLFPVAPVELDAGEHELCIEVTATRPEPWASAYLRLHGQDVVTDGSWEVTDRRPPNWPGTGHADETWGGVRLPPRALPRMHYWMFQPNAHVNMQSGWQLISPEGAWPEGQTMYFRQRFEMSARQTP